MTDRFAGFDPAVRRIFEGWEDAPPASPEFTAKIESQTKANSALFRIYTDLCASPPRGGVD